jgi:putative ABC transport system permease protein
MPKSGAVPQNVRVIMRFRHFQNGGLVREQRVLLWLEEMVRDLHHAVRGFRRGPVFATVAIVTLALGIGANALMFTFVKALLWPSLSVRNPAELIVIYSTTTNRNGDVTPYQSTSYLNARDYRDRNDVCSGLSIVIDTPATLDSADPSARVLVHLVTGEYFDVLGVQPALGRGFAADDDRTPGASPVAVLSHTLWVERFGANPGTIGTSIRLNQHAYTVIGVAPDTLRGVGALGSPDLWIPMAMHDAVLTGNDKDWFNLRAGRVASMVARLKPGVTPLMAQASLRAVGVQLEHEFPNDNAGRNVIVVPLDQTVVPPVQRPVYLLSGLLLSVIVAFVLLIACSTVANLLLARAVERRREIAIRISLGASRARLVRQFLTESLLMVVVASACGLIGAYWGRAWLLTAVPAYFRHDLTFTFDGRLWVYTAGLAILVTFLSGLAPALQASNRLTVGAIPDGAEAPSRPTRWLSVRGGLVVTQVALSLCALIMATLFSRSLAQAQHVDVGFDIAHELVASVDLGAQRYTQARGEAFSRMLINRLKGLPMVADASVADTPPVSGSFRRTTFVDGVDRTDPSNGRLNGVVSVTPGFFAAAGIRVLGGRDFTAHDTAQGEMVAIVNEAAAARMWPAQQPIGKHLHFLLQTWDVTVIGVVHTVMNLNLGEPPQPIIYLPLSQHYSPLMTVYVKTKGHPGESVSDLRAVIRSLDSSVQPLRVRAGAQILDDQLTPRRLGTRLLSAFGGLALALAGLGTYGVMSYAVSHRRREIAIRMALGAQRADVLNMVVGDGIVAAVAGVLIGLFAAFALARLFTNLLFGIGPTDPRSFALGSVWVVTFMMLACYLPMRRAIQVDPSAALRGD